MNEIRKLTDKFTSDLTRAFTHAIRERLLVGLGVQRVQAPPLVAPLKKTGLAASRARSAKVSDRTVLEAVKLAGVKGASAIEIARATKLSADSLSYRLGKLRREKKIRSAGKTSKTRYFLVRK